MYAWHVLTLEGRYELLSKLLKGLYRGDYYGYKGDTCNPGLVYLLSFKALPIQSLRAFALLFVGWVDVKELKLSYQDMAIN